MKDIIISRIQAFSGKRNIFCLNAQFIYTTPSLFLKMSVFDKKVIMQDFGIFSRPDKVRGIIAIRNLKTGSTLFLKSEDAVKSFKEERFRLDLGMHSSEELQSEYSSLGLELFTIELEEEATEDEDLDVLLDECKEKAEKKGIRLYRA